jgi:hypothetical protein
MNPKQLLEVSVDIGIEMQTEAAAACALVISRRTGYATAPYVHFTERNPELRATFGGLIDRGTPVALCTLDRVNAVVARLAEAGDGSSGN